jgi:RNA polymerase sigma-70 factor, ECF subfamily
MSQEFHVTESDRLIAAARRGDRDAFTALYHEQVGRVHAFALRLTGNRAAAETITQDVFIRAWEKLDRYSGQGSFAGWLRKLTLNLALEERRVESRWQRIGVLKIAPRGHSEAREPALDLERAIARLPTGARQVFVLHDIYGFKQREISVETQKALGTVKSQLHRARRLLREALGAEGREPLPRLRRSAGGDS